MTYEYACRTCGSNWEVEQRISDDPVTECPHCKGQDVYRCVVAAGIQLVGAGWAADGYAKKS